MKYLKKLVLICCENIVNSNKSRVQKVTNNMIEKMLSELKITSADFQKSLYEIFFFAFNTFFDSEKSQVKYTKVINYVLLCSNRTKQNIVDVQKIADIFKSFSDSYFCKMYTRKSDVLSHVNYLTANRLDARKSDFSCCCHIVENDNKIYVNFS
jgi:hypothetical protein